MSDIKFFCPNCGKPSQPLNGMKRETCPHCGKSMSKIDFSGSSERNQRQAPERYNGRGGVPNRDDHRMFDYHEDDLDFSANKNGLFKIEKEESPSNSFTIGDIANGKSVGSNGRSGSGLFDENVLNEIERDTELRKNGRR